MSIGRHVVRHGLMSGIGGVALLAAGCGDAGRGSPRAPIGPATRWIVGPGGFGPIKFGASVAELSKTLGVPVQPVTADNETCAYATPTVLPSGVALMVVDDEVVRVDVMNPRVKTLAGAAVGDTEDRLAELYPGTLSATPHKYAEQGHYLTVTPPDDSTHRIVFETDGERVVTYRSGLLPFVAYADGCS